MQVPDGKYDFFPGINFESRTSEIIFPVIQPFGHNIPSMLNEYKYQAIYDTIKAFLSLPGNSFTIKGKYKPVY
jgi:cell surface protein SprA